MGGETGRGGLVVDPPVEQVFLPQSGVIAVEQEQQPGHQHRGGLYPRVFDFLIYGGCGVVADGGIDVLTEDRGVERGHQLRGGGGGFFLFPAGDGVLTNQEPQLVVVFCDLF